ncbi:hypothetical protein IAR50_005362 [Cryptococcus sp. DSM 104548]
MSDDDEYFVASNEDELDERIRNRVVGVDGSRFTFYYPAEEIFTEAPADLEGFLSASRLTYADDGDNDLVWHHDEEDGVVQPSHQDRKRAGPRTSGWLQSLTIPIHEVAFPNASPATNRHMSYLRVTPSKGPEWIEQAAASNHKIASQHQDNPAGFSLSFVGAVELSFENDLASLASWVYNHPKRHQALGISIPNDIHQDAVRKTADYVDSMNAMEAEGLSIPQIANTYDAFRVRSILTSIDLNRGVVRDVEEGNTELPDEHLIEVRGINRTIRRRYDEENWGSYNTPFPELLSRWSRSMEDLRDAGMTELPGPLQKTGWV